MMNTYMQTMIRDRIRGIKSDLRTTPDGPIKEKLEKRITELEIQLRNQTQLNLF